MKYQSTSEVLATFNCKYTLGISSFDVSCFTTQTLLLMYPDYTDKAHPSLDFFYADTLASHTLLASYPGLGTRLTRFILFTVANIHKYLLDSTEKESLHLDDDASSLETWKYTSNTLFLIIYYLFLGRNLRKDMENTTWLY